MESDLFDDLLGLEDRFYKEGFQLGTADGAKAGRIEGRAFGLEKGFEKYVEIGRLHGKSLVWAGRLSKPQTSDSESNQIAGDGDDEDIKQSASSLDKGSTLPRSLPSLPANPRLEKHIKVLYALTEPVSLSTDNSEEAVSDFDDRLKRAFGKTKIVEKLSREEGLASVTDSNIKGGLGGRQLANGEGDGGIEDMSVLKARH